MADDSLRLTVDHIRRLAGPGAAGPSDGELLGRYVRGRDPAAFAALVERHGPLVLAACRRAVGDAQLAEDCFQAAFLALARQAPSLHGRSSLVGWLYTVARRAARKTQSRNPRWAALPAAVPAAGRDPLAELTGRELCAALDEELARLPARYREPLLLCCLEGLARDEAARRLGWSLNSLRGRLERGRELLRKRLQRRGLALPAALSAALLPGGAAEAVPPAVVHATLHAAAAPAVAVTRARFGALPLGRAYAAGAALLLAAVTGAGFWVTLGGAAPGEPSVAAVGPLDERRASAPAAERVDLSGDPLPEGAVARMGSVRLRHAGLSHYVFLPDGKTVVSAGKDRVVRFWDTATGRQVRTVGLRGDAGPGRLVLLSPDGKTLAAHDPGGIVLWEVDTGKEVRRLPAQKADVGFWCFSPDGKTLAEGLWDPRVILWDCETGESRSLPLPPRKIGMDSTFHVKISRDGKRLVAGGGWKEPLCVYDVATGKEVRRFLCDATTSTFSPDGKRLAVACMKEGGRGSLLRLFDLASGNEAAQFPLDDELHYYSLAFSPDGKTLVCGFSDKSCLVDCATGRVLHRLTGRRPIAMSFSPDGKLLAGSTGQRLRFWDPSTGQELHGQPGDFGPSLTAALSPDGRSLAATDWLDQSVSLWDTASGRFVRRFPLRGENRYVRNLTFSPDGRTLAAAQYKGFLQFWDVATGAERRSVQLAEPGRKDKYPTYLYQLYVSPDGTRASSLEQRFDGPQGEYTRLALWDTATGKPLTQHSLPAGTRVCAWRPDGNAVAVALKDGLAMVDVTTGEHRIHAPGVPGGPLATSPDFRLLAARHVPGLSSNPAVTVGVWETATGKEVAALPTGRADHIALAPDNRHLVTTDEGFLRVFDLATGRERRRWNLPVVMTDGWGNSSVTDLRVLPDGRRAFTALADGTGLVWDLSPASAPARLLSAVPDEQSLAAWWADLAGEDAGRAYAAVWRLTEAGAEAVPFLARNLRPTPAVDPKRLRQLIEELDSDAFDVRERASRQLADLGSVAEPALRQALAKDPSAEVRRRLEALLSRPAGVANSPDARRRLRAVQVLERIGSNEARRVLDGLNGTRPASGGR